MLVGVLVLVLAVVVAAGTVWLSARVRHPENAASHADEGPELDEIHGDTRPAGADAEDPVLPPVRRPEA